ncbi:3-oxoacyl-[acyl-carrier-protein] synthase III C-terminal domain-containing protein [Micromonospora matsumotoense]|uniref:3-oxoacyl-[acyl-carrier-protein] synthase III C-terminal domain-containing protein n=1 Tax=Micromonospora matsumotoense TaxID=121616 RepID=UPI00341367CE
MAETYSRTPRPTLVRPGPAPAARPDADADRPAAPEGDVPPTDAVDRMPDEGRRGAIPPPPNLTRAATLLHRVEAFTPVRSWTIEEIGAACGLNRYQTKVLRRIRGLAEVRADPDGDLFDLLVPAASAALRGLPDPAVVRYLLYAHTLPDPAPSHVLVADQLRKRLGLAETDAFAVTQQFCASGLAAIDIAGELLRADGDPAAKALVVTGEKAFNSVLRYVLQVSVTGEASTAFLVGLDTPGDGSAGGPRIDDGVSGRAHGAGSRVLSYAARTEGEFADGFRMSADTLRRFGDTYNTHLWAAMSDALSYAGLGLSDIHLVIPHNVNASLWLRLCAEVGLDRRRVFLDNIPRYGHCNCSDPFLNLASMRERDLLRSGELYLLTSVGIGSSYAAMVIEY